MTDAPRRVITSTPNQKTNKWATRFGKVFWPAVLFIVFIGVWTAIAVTVFRNASYILPSPWGVIEAGWKNWPLLWQATQQTFFESFIGLVLAVVIGVLIAVIMSQSAAAQRSIYPYAILLQTVPVVAIAPIIVLWFGYGTPSVVLVAFIIALFPVINNTLLGLISVDQNSRDLFQLHGASRMTRLAKLQFPSAMPQFIAGLRISAGLSVVGAIVGEYIIGSGGSQGGLGVKIVFSQGQLDTNMLFAEVVMATALGFAFFLAVSGAGYWFLRTWHESANRSQER